MAADYAVSARISGNQPNGLMYSGNETSIFDRCDVAYFQGILCSHGHAPRAHAEQQRPGNTGNIRFHKYAS
jgi:hypothetical protein